MEVKFNSQICTDKNQSERLLALGLKKETADMHYSTDHRGNVRQLWLLAYGDLHEDVQVHSLPAWSLHRLIEMCDINPFVFYTNCGYDNIIDRIEEYIKEGFFDTRYLEEHCLDEEE